MKTSVKILAICLILFSFHLSFAGEPSPIFLTNTTFDKVVARGQFTGKPVMLIISNKECPAVRNFTNRVLADSNVQKMYSKNFLAYKIDVETIEGRKLAYKYNALILPMIIYFSPEQNIILKSNATDDPKKAIEEVNHVLTVVNTHKMVKAQALNARNIAYLNRKVQKKTAVTYAKKDAKEGRTDVEKQAFEYTLNSEDLRFFKKAYVKTMGKYN